MKPADWDVEEALAEVIEAIKGGAGTYDLDTSTETRLKDGYRGDFEERRQAGIEWREVRVKILALAVTVGGTAAFLTTMEAMSTTGRLPSTLDEDLTITAAWMIAQGSKECTQLTTGGFCRNFPGVSGLSAQSSSTLGEAARILNPILQLVL